MHITPELVASFRAYWRALVPVGQWQERMAYPFRYLIQEGFWEIIGFGEACYLCQELMPEEAKRIARLRDALEENLMAAVQGLKRNGDVSAVCPGTSA